MSTILPTSVPSKTLASSITSAATSFTLSDIKGWNGSDLTSSEFGSLAYAVLRNSTNSLMEIIEFDPTTIASASITINKRGLKFTGDITTEVTANKLAWTKGDTFVDLGVQTPQLLKHYVTTIESVTIDDQLTYTTALTPTADADITTKKYVDDTTNGGAVSHDTVIVAGNAGETVAAGEFVYFDDTDNEWKLTDASVTATTDNIMMGIAQGAGVDGGAISGGVLTFGLDTNQTGLTIGVPYFLSDTAGAIASSAGTVSREIGFGQSTTSIYFDPYYKLGHLTTDQSAALAGDGGTPSATNPYTLLSHTKTAGATINGATLPVPVYQNDSDNEFYACDANDTAAMKFLGFAVTNGVDAGNIEVQFTGIVSGFSSLTEGEKYYVSDTAGAIANSPGTQEILVGIAISTTELMIQKGSRSAHGAATNPGTASGTQAITTGFRPTSIRLFGVVGGEAGTTSTMFGLWNSTGIIGASVHHPLDATNPTTSSSAILYHSAANYMTYTITSVTDTGFTITWTESGSYDPNYGEHIIWEAQGEL